MRVRREPRNPLSPTRVNDTIPRGEAPQGRGRRNSPEEVQRNRQEGTAQVRGRRNNPEEAQRNRQEGTAQRPRVRQPALEAHQGRDGFDGPAVQAQPAVQLGGAAPQAQPAVQMGGEAPQVVQVGGAAQSGTLPTPEIQAQQAAEVEGTAPEAGTLPPPVDLNLTGSVGNGGVNNPADVRQVQDRLHELGYLSDADHAAEQVDSAGTEPVTTQSMPRTMEALLRFQKEVTGFDDGNISPTGVTAFSLADPTYGTQSTINPQAADSTAGFPVATLPHAVTQIAHAIEAKETAGAPLGESPARLRNGSGTPASFGQGQLIGGTALNVLMGNSEAAQLYGLDEQELDSLKAIDTATREAYSDIYDQVPEGGDTEEGLQRRIAEYTGSEEGTRFREETGLGDADIENMFRTAQLLRQGSGVSSPEVLLANPDAATNVEALGLRNSDLKTFLENPEYRAEHREGFVTRALLSSEHGQALRDAMTDNGGIPLSRLLIQQNYDWVQGMSQAQLGRPLSEVEAAQATMLAHNSPSRLDEFFDSLAAGRRAQVTDYVTEGMAHWSP